MIDRTPRDIPVIFSAPMVRALLDGRKTMTRRLAWRQYPDPEVLIGKSAKGFDVVRDEQDGSIIHVRKATPWQKVEPGDRLWVRESFTRKGGKIYEWRYSADDEPFPNYFIETDMKMAVGFVGWSRSVARESIPSIHMPRVFSRLTLVVTATKIERLQNMSHKDAIAEGVAEFRSGETMFGVPVDGGFEYPGMTPQESFMSLWSSLHGAESWNENPEVVALTFRVIRANIDAPEARAA